MEYELIMGITSIIMKCKLKKWKRKGLIVGDNFEIEKGCSIDPSFPWLIEIGNSVTLAPNVCILAHDASMKYCLGKAKIGKVRIGDNVFIGTKSVILPGINIGNGSIVGASSVVTHDIPDNVVVCGAPARIISNVEDFKEKLLRKQPIEADRRKVLSEDMNYRKKIASELRETTFGFIDSK